MIQAQSIKTIPLAGPGTISTATGVTGTIDRMGYNYVSVDVALAKQASTSASTAVAHAALQVSESDDTNVTNAVTVSGLVGGTDFTIPTHSDTAEAQIIRLNIDGRARKRYLFVSLKPYATSTAATNNTVYVAANLSRAEQSPDSDTDRNVALQVNA